MFAVRVLCALENSKHLLLSLQLHANCSDRKNKDWTTLYRVVLDRIDMHYDVLFDGRHYFYFL